MAPHSIEETSPISSPTLALAPRHQKPRLYILSEFHPKAVEHAESLFDCVHHDSPEALEWRKHATAILIKDYYIKDEDLIAAPQLRVIGKQGVGLEKVDVEACKKRGVKVCNTPGVNATAVAEMAMSLAFSVARDIPQMVIRQKIEGEVIRKETVSGILLMGKTLGVIGMGNIGRETARMFHNGLRAPVITYDPYFPAESPGWEEIPHKRVHELRELLLEADILSVHVPLTPATDGLISLPQMKQMKPTSIILNTARGGIVNEEDLTVALEEGLIMGAGFDCHAQEPPPKSRYERLWNCKGFVGTPHIAAATDETQIATTNGATDQVYEFMLKEGNEWLEQDIASVLKERIVL